MDLFRRKNYGHDLKKLQNVPFNHTKGILTLLT